MSKLARVGSLGLIVLLSCLLLVACNNPLQRVGTIPRGTPDRGNGTPAVIPTVMNTPPVLKMASEQLRGKAYAFVRDNQLSLTLNGEQAQPVTHFALKDIPNVYWSTPVWSEGNKYLAFIMSAGSGGGGGGCPGPDEKVGSLYVFDTTSKQFVLVTLPTIEKNVQVTGQPRMDTWKYVVWEDATHVLAWYNGDAGNVSKSSAGLYRYDVSTQKIELVLALNAIGAQSETDVQKGLPLVLDVRYSNGQLFYQAVTRPYEQRSEIAIYSRSLKNVKQASTVQVKMGTVAWCYTVDNKPVDASYTFPGWDISANGQQLITQMTIGAIQSMQLEDRSTTILFQKVPAALLQRDVRLVWAPDSQTVVLSGTDDARMASGLYSASLTDPSAIIQYAPALNGLVTWRPDSSAFALENSRRYGEQAIVAQNVYIFAKGDAQGQTLLTNAHKFTWG